MLTINEASFMPWGDLSIVYDRFYLQTLAPVEHDVYNPVNIFHEYVSYHPMELDIFVIVRLRPAILVACM